MGIRRRLLRWALLVVVPPLLGALALWMSERMEAQQGPTRLSQGLRHTGHVLRRQQRGLA
ncbi:MAG TPA: hypothetical protein VMU14_16425 [Acidimicrobiales bacterium]|nr:hypothetical protein [Acidimicrobiales bacterium]